MLVLLCATVLWVLTIYVYVGNNIKYSFSEDVNTIKKSFVANNITLDNVSKIRESTLYYNLNSLSENENIAAYAFLNADKTTNYSEATFQRDAVFWKIKAIFPIYEKDNLIGWLKIWPTSRFILSKIVKMENLYFGLVSFFIIAILIFSIRAIVTYSRYFFPLFEVKRIIKKISYGNAPDLEIKGDDKLWKSIRKSLSKLSSKVFDTDITMNLLFSVSKALTSKIDINNIYSIILEIVNRRYPDSMSAVILPSESGFLKIVAKRGYSHDFNPSIKIDDANPVSDAYITGRTATIKNLKSDDFKRANDFVLEGVVTQINIPIISEDGKCQGVLNISSKSKDILEKDVTNTINLVADYLAIAMKNIDTYKKIKEHNQRLEKEISTATNELVQTNARLIKRVRDIKGLSDISAYASTKFNLEVIIPFIIQQILNLTSLETSGFLVKDIGSDDYRFIKNSFSINNHEKLNRVFNSKNSNIIKEIESGKDSIVLQDHSAVREQAEEFNDIVPIFSAIFVPVLNNGKVIGVVISVNKFGAKISENDVSLIKHIAVLFSGILEKVKLYSALEKKVNELTFLQRVSSAIATTPDLEKILEKLIDVTKDAFNADLCAVLLYDKESQNLITQPGAFFTGGSEKVLLKIHKDDQDSLSAKTFREGAAHLSHDATADPSIRSHSARDWGIKSIIIVPLINDETVIGVLRVGKHEANAYTKEDEALIMMIANQAAIIIENANLYKKLSLCKVD